MGGGARADDPDRAGGRSRALGPGSRRAVIVALVGGAVACALVVAVGGGSRGVPSARYGGIPSWLPKPKVHVGRVATASPAHPWLAIEGDTVSVRLLHGRTLATAVGPSVPHEGQFPVPPSTPCTFTVTFSAARGSVPLRAGAFTIVDELGRRHHPRVSGRHGGAPPRRVADGRTVTLVVRDVLPTGNGRLRWTPAGSAAIVSWDFEVEID